MFRPGELLFLAGFAWVVKVRWPHRKRDKAESRLDGLERTLLRGMALGFVILPIASCVSRRLQRWDVPTTPLRTAAGAALFGAGVALLDAAHRDLGRQFSPTLEIAHDHQLVTHGVYRHVRHPMYTAGFLWAFGQMLLIPNLVAGPAALPAIAFLTALRLPREEAMLRELFGAEYDEWRERTGALWPRS